MLDLKIDRLILNIENGSGHEHRIGPIVERAVALFAERAVTSSEGETARPDALQAVSGRAVDLNLNSTSNELAARAIADAWLRGMVLKLRR